MEVYISLDRMQYKVKPLEEIPSIKRRAAEGWTKMDVAELAEMVGNRGCAIVPGHMQGGIKAENCTEMQLLVLDFDGGIRFTQVKDRCSQFGLPITFAYHTFSSTEQKEKFRVVFAYECLLADTFAIKTVIAMLYRIFPECDQACKNLDRLFLGGKGLIYFDEEACISLTEILAPFYQSLDNDKNFKRNVISFCRKQGVLAVDGMPAIRGIGQMEGMAEADKDKVLDSAILHEVGAHGNPSFFILENKGGAKSSQATICTEKPRRLGVTGEINCQLLDDFNRGIQLSHDAQFAICTNLLQINGGRKHFLETMEKHYGMAKREKWEKDMRYMKGYFSHCCSEKFCPYYGEGGCENEKNIVKTLAMDRKIRRAEETYYSLEEAVGCLEHNLEMAFESSEDGIHLIRAQTGLGKTSAYIKLIERHPGKKFLVALPTNMLKEQVAANISKRIGGDVFVTASIHGNRFIPSGAQDEISQAHNQGFHNRTKEIIKNYYESIKDDSKHKEEAQECMEILEGLKGLKEERVVVTTHAYFTHIPDEFLKQFVVIIDEDILMLQTMNRTSSVSESCLKKLLEVGNVEYTKIAAEMLGTPEGKYRRIGGSPYAAAFSQKELEGVEMTQSDNINDIALVGSFVRKGGTVNYFYPQKFQKMKYIILSATLNETIYREYFRGHMEIHLYEEKKACYKGRLVQYTYNSLGRLDLDKKRDGIAWFMKELAKRLEGRPSPDVITFKSEKKIAEIFGHHSKLHFGNTCGMNNMSGHDIEIVGTPYKVEEAYKLVACYLGADVNKKADEKPRPRRVNYKRCSFLIVTYEEPLLQELQLYSLESDLEQCIGRARLLREECTVYLLSSFPCEQAELHTKNYLKGG